MRKPDSGQPLPMIVPTPLDILLQMFDFHPPWRISLLILFILKFQHYYLFPRGFQPPLSCFQHLPWLSQHALLLILLIHILCMAFQLLVFLFLSICLSFLGIWLLNLPNQVQKTPNLFIDACT